MEVWKYQLELKDKQVLSMPVKAKILNVQTIRNRPWLLALVNPTTDTTDRIVRVYETGDTIKGGKYAGSHQDDTGTFLYHIFDDGEKEG